jgi:hypothetical protein
MERQVKYVSDNMLTIGLTGPYPFENIDVLQP